MTSARSKCVRLCMFTALLLWAAGFTQAKQTNTQDEKSQRSSKVTQPAKPTSTQSPESAIPPQPQGPPLNADVGTLLKSATDTATLAINEVREHAEQIRNYYETLSKLVVYGGGVLALILGWFGWLDRKERRATEQDLEARYARLEQQTLKLQKEAFDRLSESTAYSQEVVGLRKDLQEQIALASQTIKALKETETKTSVWILDVVRATSAVTVANMLGGEEEKHKRFLFAVAVDLLERITVDHEIEMPIRAQGYRLLAGIYKRRDQLTDAWKAIQQSLELTAKDKRDPWLFYNAACYASLNRLKEDALKYLQEALRREPTLVRQEARDEKDFDPIRNDPTFKDLVGLGDDDKRPATGSAEDSSRKG